MNIKWRVAVIALLALVLLGTAPNSWAETPEECAATSPHSCVGTGAGEDTMTAWGESATSDTTGTTAVSSGPTVPVRAVVYCRDGAVATGGDDGQILNDPSASTAEFFRTFCTDAPEAQCPPDADGTPGEFGAIYIGTAAGTDPIANPGSKIQRCFTPGEAAGAPRFRGVTQADFRRLPIAPQNIIVQPPNGRTLINVRTNVYTQPATQNFTTTIVGFRVQVRATPAHYTWTFGDGGTLATSDPGAAYPNLRTTHTYTKTGNYNIGLATTYTGQYSLDGGATWLNVDGTATVTSPAVPITAMHIHTELITGNQ